jgi:hypothetical protein
VPAQDQFTFIDLLERLGLKYRETKERDWIRGLAILPPHRLQLSGRTP